VTKPQNSKTVVEQIHDLPFLTDTSTKRPGEQFFYSNHLRLIRLSDRTDVLILFDYRNASWVKRVDILTATRLLDFEFRQLCQSDLHYFGILRSVEW